MYLVNTGWTGGKYGVGKRMSLKATRAMVTAALNGSLAKVEYKKEPYFGLNIPVCCEGVDSAVLDPQNTWSDKKITHRRQKACFALCGEFHDKVSRYARKHSKSRT